LRHLGAEFRIKRHLHKASLEDRRAISRNFWRRREGQRHEERALGEFEIGAVLRQEQKFPAFTQTQIALAQ
jgi:hypothetical protein